RVQGSTDARDVESATFGACALDRRAAIGEVLFRQAPHLQEDEQRWGWAIDRGTRASFEDLDFVAPAIDSPHEEVRGGVHCFGRQSELDGEIHESVALLERSSETHDVDVFGPATRREPQRRERAAHARLAQGPDDVPPAIREPLLAWLRALRHHWPSSFERLAGADGRQLLERLEAAPIDENRCVKLRRIAIENLASRL